MKDLYEKFAYDYDEFGAIEEYLGAEKLFLDTLFKQYRVKNILDCACGTGQHLLMLLQSGYQVSGLDFSESMIEVAKRSLNEAGYKKIRIYGDYEQNSYNQESLRLIVVAEV